MKLAPVLATVLVSVSLTGCGSEPEEPSLFSFDEIRYWFEDDILVINLTMTNRGNMTPGPPESLDPLLGFLVTTWRAKMESGQQPGEDLDWMGFSPTQLDFTSTGSGPAQKRWYDAKASEALGIHVPNTLGPIKLRPGDSITVEFGFLPQERLVGVEGYYDIRITMHVEPTRSGIGSDTRYQSGCFNHEIDEFYGVSLTGPDCKWFNADGRPTRVGAVAHFGKEQPGLPKMSRSPPPEVEGAH